MYPFLSRQCMYISQCKSGGCKKLFFLHLHAKILKFYALNNIPVFMWIFPFHVNNVDVKRPFILLSLKDRMKQTTSIICLYYGWRGNLAPKESFRRSKRRHEEGPGTQQVTCLQKYWRFWLFKRQRALLLANLLKRDLSARVFSDPLFLTPRRPWGRGCVWKVWPWKWLGFWA